MKKRYWICSTTQVIEQICLLLLPGFLALLFFSCVNPAGEPSYNPEMDPSYGNFWAYNFSTETYYRLDAEMIASGDLCEIWVDKKSGVDKVRADALVNMYEGIYRQMVAVFSIGRPVTIEGRTAADTMEAADLLGDGNNKLCILLLDIRDGYQSRGDVFTGGYFTNGNFFDNGSFLCSNERDMIYVDTYPSELGGSLSNDTIAHEMQHLMNYVTTEVLKKEGGRQTAMELWIDEGLAASAEWICSGEYSKYRLWWFGADPLTTISQRNNFYVWGNYGEIDPSVILDDYATVYMFFRWFELQFWTGENNPYNEIITSPYSDYRAVTGATNGGYSNTGAGWEALLKDWLLASYINAPEGRHGYLGAPALKDLRIRTVSPEVQHELRLQHKLDQYPLYPGEAVYSLIAEGNDKPYSAGNIRYTTLNKNAGETGGFAKGDILLAFNSGTANDGHNAEKPNVSSENATITGNADPDDWDDWPVSSAARAAFANAERRTFPGSFVIGARDAGRLNRYRKNNSGGGPALVPRRLEIDE